MHKQRHYKTSNKKELSRKRKNQKHEYYQIKRINEIYLNIARLNVDEQEIPNDNPGRDSDTKSKKPQNRTYHAHFDPLRLKKNHQIACHCSERNAADQSSFKEVESFWQNFNMNETNLHVPPIIFLLITSPVS
jgi:hypothetical protein